MAKVCQKDGCNYNVFGGSFCRLHQYLRTDKKKNHKLVEGTLVKQRSEIDVFKEIWDERPHISELSGLPLPYGPNNMQNWVKQFLHVINKGRSNDLRLVKRNIMLGTPEEHEHQDQYEAFRQRKIEMLREMYVKNNPDQI
jgi:hypothetical protein